MAEKGRLQTSLVAMTNGYRLVETDELVNAQPALRTRFHWRARRAVRRLNAERFAPSYRWGIVKEGGRWLVVAKQNRLEPD